MDCSRPYFVSSKLDAERISELRTKLDRLGVDIRHISDDELVRAMRAIQDAAVHLGGNIDVAQTLTDFISGVLRPNGDRVRLGQIPVGDTTVVTARRPR